MRVALGFALLLVAGCGGRVEGSPGSSPDAGSPGSQPSLSSPGSADAAFPESDTDAGACAPGVATIATTSTPIDAMASDGVDVFLLDGAGQTLSAVPVGGGAPRVVATFSFWDGWNGNCVAQYPGGVTTYSTCHTFSVVLDADTAYAVGPLGVVAAPKIGGAARTLATVNGTSDYILGPAVAAAGALFWIQSHTTSDGGGTAFIQRLDLSSGTLTTLVTEPPSGSVSSVLATDAVHLYWASEGAIQSTPLSGGPTTTVISSSALRPGDLGVAGNLILWVNGEVSGGTCEGCPAPTPQPEMVQSAPLTGGESSTLITYPMAADPTVSVFGDPDFAYVVSTPLTDPGSSPATLQAFPITGGSPTALVDGLSIGATTQDANSVYFAACDGIQKVGKPTP